MANTIAVIGAGSWGTAFADLLAKNNPSRQVTLWARREQLAQEINDHHTNEQYLPGIGLSTNLAASNNLNLLCGTADLIVIAVPIIVLRDMLRQAADSLNRGAVVVSLIKGIEPRSGKRASEIIADIWQLPANRLMVLSGPNLAREIAEGQPAMAVLSGSSTQALAQADRVIASAHFHLVRSRDLAGVETAGIMKNIIAVALGIAEGLGLGLNTQGALAYKGLQEMREVIGLMHGRVKTAEGLAGLGDTVATGFSSQSRNHAAGKALAGSRHESLAGGPAPEGITSAPVIASLARKAGVSLSITGYVASVIEGHRATTEDIGRLLD